MSPSNLEYKIPSDIISALVKADMSQYISNTIIINFLGITHLQITLFGKIDTDQEKILKDRLVSAVGDEVEVSIVL